jgi:hypothetical protein
MRCFKQSLNLRSSIAFSYGRWLIITWLETSLFLSLFLPMWSKHKRDYTPGHGQMTTSDAKQTKHTVYELQMNQPQSCMPSNSHTQRMTDASNKSVLSPSRPCLCLSLFIYHSMHLLNDLNNACCRSRTRRVHSSSPQRSLQYRQVSSFLRNLR